MRDEGRKEGRKEEGGRKEGRKEGRKGVHVRGCAREVPWRALVYSSCVYSFCARGRCSVTSPKPLSGSRLSCPNGVTPIDHRRQKERPPPSESRARDPEATSLSSVANSVRSHRGRVSSARVRPLEQGSLKLHTGRDASETGKLSTVALLALSYSRAAGRESSETGNLSPLDLSHHTRPGMRHSSLVETDLRWI